MTLKEIKDNLAKQYNHVNWSAFRNKCFKDSVNGYTDMEAMMNEVCILSQKQALKNASENVKLDILSAESKYDVQADKQSILSENNLVK